MKASTTLEKQMEVVVMEQSTNQDDEAGIVGNSNNRDGDTTTIAIKPVPKSPTLRDTSRALTIMSPIAKNQIPTMNIKKQQKQFILRLNTNDDVWHRWIFPCNNIDSKNNLQTLQTINQNKRRADAMVKHLYSKTNVFIGMLLGFMSFIVRFYFFNYQIIPAFLSFLWIIAWLFTYNISMTHKLIVSFIFWFKLYNWIIFISCYALLVHVDLAIEGFNFITGTMVIVVVATHDGCRLKRIYKLLLCSMTVIMLIFMFGFTYFEGQFSAFGKATVFDNRDIIIFGQGIGLKSSALAALTNLLIFFSKQAWVMGKHKNRSGVIQTRPKIEWIDDWEGYKRQVSMSHSTIFDAILQTMSTDLNNDHRQQGMQLVFDE